MTTNAQQMNALVMHAAGAPAQALEVRSVPVPVPAPGEVLVEVHASGVNPFDVVIAAGLLGSPLPMTPGIDFAGTVVSDGPLHGQDVYGSQAYLGWQRPGAHARYVALPETWVSRKPAALTMAQAGAVGRPYISAWQTLIAIMDIQPGETLLVTGGSGLVGQAATSIAHWRGAKVIIAGRHKPAADVDYVDTATAGLTEAVLELTGGKGADLALDLIGGDLFEPAVKSLRFGGRMAGLHNHQRVEFDPSEIYDHDRHVTGLASVFIDGAAGAKVFDRLAPLFDNGLLTPPATTTWALEDAVQAYQTVQDGDAGVKQVLLPAGQA